MQEENTDGSQTDTHEALTSDHPNNNLGMQGEKMRKKNLPFFFSEHKLNVSQNHTQ